MMSFLTNCGFRVIMLKTTRKIYYYITSQEECKEGSSIISEIYKKVNPILNTL